MLQDPNQNKNNQQADTQSPTNPSQPGQNAQANQAGTADSRLRQNRGTGFTNISTILNANQGAGQKMGQAIGSGIDKQADSVREGIQQGQANFNTGMQAGVQSANTNIQAGKNLVQQAGESNDAYATRVGQSNGTDYAKIGQNLANANYNGPTALNNASQIQSQAATASALGRLAGTNAGQGQLLQNMVAQRGNYNTGQNALDSLLVGREGQSAIQAGRRSANGIGQQATDATSAAAAQAAAAKAAIDTSRTNTTAALQNQLTGDGTSDSNNVTGLTTLATNQAKDFQANAARLQQLLNGQVNASQVTDADKALLSNMSNYGVNNYNLYDKNDDAVKAAISNLANTMQTNFGSSLYQGNQQQAAMNLADVLQQSDLKKSIDNNTFNNDAFAGDESKVFGSLDTQRTADQQRKDYLNQFASDLTGAQAEANNRLSHGYGNFGQDLSGADYDDAQQKIAQQVANDMLSKYGNLAMGQTVDSSQGFGKTGPDNKNLLRDAGSVQAMANTALGGDMDLQTFVLQKILGQK